MPKTFWGGSPCAPDNLCMFKSQSPSLTRGREREKRGAWGGGGVSKHVQQVHVSAQTWMMSALAIYAPAPQRSDAFDRRGFFFTWGFRWVLSSRPLSWFSIVRTLDGFIHYPSFIGFHLYREHASAQGVVLFLKVHIIWRLGPNGEQSSG